MRPDAEPQEVREWVQRHLDPLESHAHDRPHRSDFDLNPELTPEGETLTPAAVLVPIVQREEGFSVLLTRRADTLRRHTGQIALPGGRMDPGETPWDAALRETEEEIGLQRAFVEVLGHLPDHAVITGYRVTPVVGLVRPGFELVLDPTEVAGTFEAPLRHLLDPSKHARRTRRIAGEDIETFDLPWGSFNIWGATAGMLLTLREVLGEAHSRGH